MMGRQTGDQSQLFYLAAFLALVPLLLPTSTQDRAKIGIMLDTPHVEPVRVGHVQPPISRARPPAAGRAHQRPLCVSRCKAS